MIWITDPLSFDFMRQAYAITLLIAVPMAILSCFLVLKGWSLLGDAIAHAVLPGVVVAYILAIPLGIGAFLAGMLCALLTGYLSEHSRVKRDTVMGVVFSGMFALGLVLYVAIQSAVDLTHILFGTMLGVGWDDTLLTGAISAVVLGFLLLVGRDLTLWLFDAQHARAIGLRTRALNYALLAAISLCVVAALKALGIILAIAFLIAPGAIAFLATNRFGRMVALSVLVAVGCSIAGITLSFWLDSAPAPTIVVVMTALFIVVFAGTQLRLWRGRGLTRSS